jgi:hypothetical protein
VEGPLDLGEVEGIKFKNCLFSNLKVFGSLEATWRLSEKVH